LVLSLASEAQPLPAAASGDAPVSLLSGPEGGFAAAEEAAALAAGYARVTLGPRVLRAETAPLAALSVLA
jgi:16S rRNA (uracil1498-N3)-methyltransferase